ncbi:periphilin-1 isoform X1 [Aquarana catesbeiana]|uniref:periphilin-1 isoform X1 n=1 Tax=Aquarana catesbeiana TaxID=8400 RepID=UPI003CC9918A
MEYRKDELWAEGRYEYERVPRHRLPPRDIPPDGEYHRVVNLVRRPEEEGYHRYEEYGEPDYRDYEESHAYERKGGGPYRGEEPGYRWARGEAHMSRHAEYRMFSTCGSDTAVLMSSHQANWRENREGFRRKTLCQPPYIRERSPHRRESPYFRESPVTRKDSPHSRSGSSVSSRSYSPERGKTFPTHQHKNKDKSSTHPLRSSKDPSPSSSGAITTNKSGDQDKGSRLSSEIAFVDAACKWVSEKMEKVSESNVPEATEDFVKAGSSSALYGDQIADLEANAPVNSERYDLNPVSNRSKAIAGKTKEIEEVYRQDCETFGMVVKMLIDKDPSLEKQVQFALRQNLSEIGERCIEELKLYIADYDAAHQELA